MEEHRGRHRVELMRKNRELIKAWLEKNPREPMKQCSKDLGLSYLTVRNHINSILRNRG
jgi:hypothetical protein